MVLASACGATLVASGAERLAAALVLARRGRPYAPLSSRAVRTSEGQAAALVSAVLNRDSASACGEDRLPVPQLAVAVAECANTRRVPLVRQERSYEEQRC